VITSDVLTLQADEDGRGVIIETGTAVVLGVPAIKLAIRDQRSGRYSGAYLSPDQAWRLVAAIAAAAGALDATEASE
jgi:hypothetical protein